MNSLAHPNDGTVASRCTCAKCPRFYLIGLVDHYTLTNTSESNGESMGPQRNTTFLYKEVTSDQCPFHRDVFVKSSFLSSPFPSRSRHSFLLVRCGPRASPVTTFTTSSLYKIASLHAFHGETSASRTVDVHTSDPSFWTSVLCSPKRQGNKKKRQQK